MYAFSFLQAIADQGEVTQLLSQDLSSSDTSRDDLEKELSDLLVADKQATEAECEGLADLMEGLSVRGTSKISLHCFSWILIPSEGKIHLFDKIYITIK